MRNETDQDKLGMAGLLGFASMSLQSRAYFCCPSIPLLLLIFPQFPFQKSYQLQQDQHLVRENKTKSYHLQNFTYLRFLNNTVLITCMGILNSYLHFSLQRLHFKQLFYLLFNTQKTWRMPAVVLLFCTILHSWFLTLML